MKKIIGTRHESGGLYVLDSPILKPVACSSILIHYQLGHPSLALLKKLYPMFHNVFTLDYESCQFAKYHRLSLSPRVNKRASSPFELVHSDIWGSCLIISKIGFRYFVTFFYDYSRMT